MGSTESPIFRVVDDDLDGLLAVIGYLKTPPIVMDGKRTNLSEKVAWLRGIPRRDESSGEVANNRLSSLKHLRKSLKILSTSLDRVIESVKKEDLPVARAAGFTSLPEELVERVIEFAHAQHRSSLAGKHFLSLLKWTTLLSSVNKEFRRIALRLPSLWEDISIDVPPSAITMLSRRCPNPTVHVQESPNGQGWRIRALVNAAKANSQWKELNISFYMERTGNYLLSILGELVYLPFSNLVSLTLRNEGYKDMSEHATNLSPSSDRILSSWDLSNLVSLEVLNVIPPEMKIPNLRRCHIELRRPENIDNGYPFEWDIQALHDFFQSLKSISDFTLIVSNASSSAPTIGGLPAPLPSLASFTLRLGPDVKPIVVSQLMGSLRMPNLQRMDILMKFKGDRGIVSQWFSALFQFRRGDFYAKLEEFCIEVQDLEGAKLSYEDMYFAMPNVRRMSLTLPECHTIPEDIQGHYLTDLRSLRLVNCTSFKGRSIASLMINLKGYNGMKDFEKLEIVGHTRMREEILRKRLGDKLVWNSTEINLFD